MTEPSPESYPSSPKQVGVIDVSDPKTYWLGTQIANPGDRLPLQFSTPSIFFRTQSGNIYLIARSNSPIGYTTEQPGQARFINVNLSLQTGSESAFLLPEDWLKQQSLVIGQAFTFPGGRTTNVVEIVGMSDTAVISKELVGKSEDNIAKERSSIWKEFHTKLASIRDSQSQS